MVRSFLFTAGVLLLFSGSGGSQTRFVVDASGGAGSHFKDLPKAVASVPSGSFLYIRPGNYRPFHVSLKALHLRGAGPGKTRILLDENSGNVTIEKLRRGEVFVLEDLSIEPGFYDYIPFLLPNPPAPSSPYLFLRFGCFILRNVEIRGFRRGPYKGNQWNNNVRQGRGLVQAEWCYLHAKGLVVWCGAEQRPTDHPSVPLPAGLACVYSYLDLVGGKISGTQSYSPQSASRIRSSGAPGLLLLGSMAELFDPRIVGGGGSFSTYGLNRNSKVPPGNGGPGILLDWKSLALLEGGLVRGGIRGQWQIHPFAALHLGSNGPGLEVRKDSLVRSRGTKVEGGRYLPSSPGPVWTGKGVYKVFKGPVKRPALEWVRESSFPDKGKLLLHAPPGSLVLLLASPRPDWIPLGPLGLFGTLYLDPAAFFPLGAVKVPGNGIWALPMGHPRGLGIVGPWFLQAVRLPEGNQTITSNPVEVVFWP